MRAARDAVTRFPSPSTVTIPLPSACTANIRHERSAPVHYHDRACATHAMLAAEMRAGQAALFAQRISQGLARFDRQKRCRSPFTSSSMSIRGFIDRLRCNARNVTA